MRTLVHLSDPHFGTEDPAIVAALLAELAATAPDLVAISGDLTQRARPEQFAAARRFLDQLRIPRIVVPGNHDVPLYDVVSRLLRPLARYREHITEDLAPSYHDAELAVAGVNTAHGLTGKGGRITGEQLTTICTQLGEHASQWKVVVAHHPFVVPDGVHEDLVEGAEDALPRLERCGVDVILTGHLHVPFSADVGFRSADRKLVAVHAGTCMSTRLRGEPNSYNRLAFDGNRLTIVPRVWDGRGFVDGASKRYDRRQAAGEPATFARVP
jgi:3',5'-cyclic AMP phosphodiesterase CpdA